jgi:hypothetical protein
MFWKILLTAGLIFAAYLTLKSRLRGPTTAAAKGPPLLPREWIRAAAIGALAVMTLGSGWYLWRNWEYANRVLDVQVVNAATGAIVQYQARRRDIDGRVIRTLDGREIRMADVERMILAEPASGR